MLEPQSEAVINSYTKDGIEYITLKLNKSCHAELSCEVDAEGTSSVALTLNKATAKEVLVHLQLNYGMEDWECAARLTKEQFEFLNKMAEAQEMTMEDAIRQLIQEKIDREES